jgi:hypothetical protein
MLSSPGSIFSIEGPNEVNTQTFLYLGRSSTNPVVAARAMEAISRAVRSDPSLSTVPLLSLSISNGREDWRTYQDQLGDLSPYVDRGNWHVYFNKGLQPGPSVASMYRDAIRTTPGKPVVFTELGYFTGYMYRTGAGVDELTQAKNTLNGLMDAFKMGVAHTYLYELTEGSSQPSKVDFEETFGLFHADGTPKPAAVAIHNLSAILLETVPTARTGKSDILLYSIRDLPPTGGSLLLEQSPDVFELIVWNEASDWDAARHRNIEAASVQTTIDFTMGTYDAEIYDPLRGTEAIERFSGVHTVSLDVADHPLILKVTPQKDGRHVIGK